MENYCLERRGTYDSPYDHQLGSKLGNYYHLGSKLGNYYQLGSKLGNYYQLDIRDEQNEGKLVKTMEPSFFYMLCMM